MTPLNHIYAVGDQVVYTNDFGVCWGVKTITRLDSHPTTRDDDGPRKPTYHYKGSDTPWFPVSERNLSPADEEDLWFAAMGIDEHFQRKHGFIPTLEALGGCY